MRASFYMLHASDSQSTATLTKRSELLRVLQPMLSPSAPVPPFRMGCAPSAVAELGVVRRNCENCLNQ